MRWPPGPRSGAASGGATRSATLLIAAHADQSDAMLPAVSMSSADTAKRFARPNTAMGRELDASRAPHVATDVAPPTSQPEWPPTSYAMW